MRGNGEQKQAGPKGGAVGQPTAAERREMRLKQALKANMAKRKAQTKARADSALDDTEQETG